MWTALFQIFMCYVIGSITTTVVFFFLYHRGLDAYLDWSLFKEDVANWYALTPAGKMRGREVKHSVSQVLTTMPKSTLQKACFILCLVFPFYILLELINDWTNKELINRYLEEKKKGNV